MDTPTPADVRATLAAFDACHQKIVAGMLSVMIQNPAQVREREWIAEQLTQMSLMAGDFDAETPDQGIAAVQDFLLANTDELLRASFQLFQRVGLDLAPQAESGFTFDEAMRLGLSYMPTIGEDAVPQADAPRDLGEQPIARLMAERELKPKDLVAASADQITHKMVTRAMKGRRLTPNTMRKVHRAMNRATGVEHPQAELFNYKP
ncbi:MAG: hypothetical protein ACI8QZ_000378 [Chlamydiales bacterium]|jgi:hypothetical protein